MGRLFTIIALIALCSLSADPSFAAEPQKAVRPRANFSVISGSVTKIDNSDPANIKLDVKNDTDGTMRTVTVTPWTNITKVTDISELKIGESVRIMSRKVDDKEVGMGIMFGKIKRMPGPKTAPAKGTVKQGTVKE